jgi:phosphoribosylanthranilate isomerase
MKVKVCGLTSAKQLKIAIENKADFCGFILNYPKSHRHIAFNKAVKLTKIKKGKTKFVGVLVNPSCEEFKKFTKLNLDYFQLYGKYNNDEIFKIKKKYKKKIIFAIQVKSRKDILNYIKIKKSADIILWDSSGLEKSISWNYSWIKKIPKNITKMIAGNINIDKLDKISKLADIVDVSGALETNKIKDPNKIEKFLKYAKKIIIQN